MLGGSSSLSTTRVITRTRKSIETGTLVASEDMLSHRGVALHDTDRGGDITYHGPGQVVCYPIIDLNAAGLRIHAYIRLLEQAIIDTLGDQGIEARRDPGATGVWVEHDGALAKIAAIGVRVRRWITLHGLALNVDPDLDHFSLIVPCGLAGRPVTSLARVLGDTEPLRGRGRGRARGSGGGSARRGRRNPPAPASVDSATPRPPETPPGPIGASRVCDRHTLIVPSPSCAP